MSVDLSKAQTKFDSTIDHLKLELGGLRAGRANTKLVEGIKVDAYGQPMPIEQVANINVADPSLLTIQPWDKSLVPAIEKAVSTANIGINPTVDGDIIRLPIPALTEERRKEYVKLMKQKLEEARIAVRQIRQDFLHEIEGQDGVSEDQLKGEEKRLQVLVDKTNETIEQIGEEKEKELMTV